MKISPRGLVPFNIRQRDKDLNNLIKSLPEGDGAEALRELIRSGIAYQKLALKGEVPENRLTAMIKFDSALEVIVDEYFAGGPVQSKEMEKGEEMKVSSSILPSKNVRNTIIPEPVPDESEELEELDEDHAAPEAPIKDETEESVDEDHDELKDLELPDGFEANLFGSSLGTSHIITRKK